MPQVFLFTPKKAQKTRGFMIFLGGIERVLLYEMG